MVRVGLGVEGQVQGWGRVRVRVGLGVKVRG